MSSVIRRVAQLKEGLTRFVKPESPCYEDSDIGEDRLFPFTYSNGILDITYEGNTFKAQMVDISGVEPSSETEVAIRILGSPRVVTGLGDNFKEYIREWRKATIDPASPIEIYIAPQVIRVQEADITDITADSDESYRISTTAPASDNYISGSLSNGYRTTYVFKTPLTFTIVEGGTTKYITFRTVMDQE
jgi:hypothetical protein